MALGATEPWSWILSNALNGSCRAVGAPVLGSQGPFVALAVVTLAPGAVSRSNAPAARGRFTGFGLIAKRGAICIDGTAWE
jgi:hypothetical protein